ncbi:hypothetical protein Nepgr_021659 [Nepenthes gracilis]|uniref:Uncharacterized protein n=1 Tax=Nepenthes gracilis TaxID=150966 RepID=A0AAD3SX59_NEPGR|nr:hypothetical protein Nepgr_021659 [Nepenthes gracilis]
MLILRTVQLLQFLMALGSGRDAAAFASYCWKPWGVALCCSGQWTLLHAVLVYLMPGLLSFADSGMAAGLFWCIGSLLAASRWCHLMIWWLFWCLQSADSCSLLAILVPRSSRASVRSTISAPAKQQQKGPGIPANPPPSASLNVKLATNFQISESVEDIQHATGHISSAYLQQAPAASESCIEAHHCNPKQYQTMLLHLPQQQSSMYSREAPPTSLATLHTVSASQTRQQKEASNRQYCTFAYTYCIPRLQQEATRPA